MEPGNHGDEEQLQAFEFDLLALPEEVLSIILKGLPCEQLLSVSRVSAMQLTA
jgi:hypothetical protein